MSHMPADSIAFVIPTRNRRDDLTRMLGSLVAQTRRPDQIVVVDGGDEGQTVEDVCRHFSELGVDYVRVFPPSLAKQRNAGMAVVRPGIALAGYLDDDLVLEPGAIANMMRFWAGCGDRVGGAAFNITNVPRPAFSRLKQLFGLDDPRPGAVMTSGYQTMICPVDATTKTDWLFGGATVWRREVIEAFAYDEWFVGTGYLEDVDYSHRVRQRFELWVVADARLEHLSPPIRSEMHRRIGQWEVINRLYFVRKHAHLSRARWALALGGYMLVNATKAVVNRDRDSLNRLRGTLSALPIVLRTRGELPRLGGIMK
jgi:glycosyltransferase involved in cell wall biosynthesis